MFGKLLTHSVTKIDNILIAVFGSSVCIFNAWNELCVKVLTFSDESDIIALHLSREKEQYSIRTVHQDGKTIESKINIVSNGEVVSVHDFEEIASSSTMGHKNLTSSQKAKKGQEESLQMGRFLDKERILLIDSKNKVSVFNVNSGEKQPLWKIEESEQKDGEKYSTKTPLCSVEMECFTLGFGNKIRIYNINDIHSYKEFEHTTEITSVASVGNHLAIGDVRGKIILIYNFFTSSQKEQKVQSTLEWHTGPVKSLVSNGQYIYSGGEESVIVLWHLRDLSKDFLPRVRTTILNISICQESNELICSLSDNTIKTIDLGRDKETRSFRTIVDPKGYAYNPEYPEFSQETTCFVGSKLILNGIPGEIQLIDLERNGENTLIEIVPRNLVNSINNDIMKPHRITSLCSTKDSQYLCVGLETESSNYLKFYRKSAEGYTLLSKILSPHTKRITQIFCIESINPIFVTIAQGEELARVWGLKKEKKKTLIDVEESYFTCVQILGHRNLKITHCELSSFSSSLSFVFEEGESIVFHFCEGEFCMERAVKLDPLTLKIKAIEGGVVLVRGEGGRKCLEVWGKGLGGKGQEGKEKEGKGKGKGKGEGKGEEKGERKGEGLRVDLGDVRDVKFVEGRERVGVVVGQEGFTRVLLLDLKTMKFVENYDFEEEIWAAFWKGDSLILLTKDLKLVSLDDQEIITFEKNDSELAIEEESTEIKSYERDLFKLNERWCEKQSLKHHKKIEEHFEGVHLLPNCEVAFKQFVGGILL